MKYLVVTTLMIRQRWHWMRPVIHTLDIGHRGIILVRLSIPIELLQVGSVEMWIEIVRWGRPAR